jgi:polyisoprenoid-binding protein YceI
MKFLMTALIALSFNAIANVDVAKSEFKWTGKKIAGPHYGKVALQSGKVVEENGMLKGGEFVIDLNKMTVEDISGEWADKLIGHLKSPDFLEVAKYPTAKLVVKSVKGDAVTADLTVKDKTHPVNFSVKKDGATYAGTLNFDRTKYGMQYNSKDFFDVKALGDKVIDNEVVLDFKVVVAAAADATKPNKKK